MGSNTRKNWVDSLQVYMQDLERLRDNLQDLAAAFRLTGNTCVADQLLTLSGDSSDIRKGINKVVDEKLGVDLDDAWKSQVATLKATMSKLKPGPITLEQALSILPSTASIWIREFVASEHEEIPAKDSLHDRNELIEEMNVSGKQGAEFTFLVQEPSDGRSVAIFSYQVSTHVYHQIYAGRPEPRMP